MSTGTNQSWHHVGGDELRQSWGWILALGIIMVILGVMALSWSVMTTLVSVVFFGWMLLIGGGLSVIHAFMRRRWGGFFSELISGVLYLVVGLMVVINPAASAVALTLLIAMFLLIGGIFRIIAALLIRLGHWVWMLVNGLISVVLGVMIWSEWPTSGLWVIGMFIGIDMVFYGWSLIMLAVAAKNMPQQL